MASLIPASSVAWNSELLMTPWVVSGRTSTGRLMTSDAKPSACRTTVKVSLGLNRLLSSITSPSRCRTRNNSPGYSRSSRARISGSERRLARSASDSCSRRKIWSMVSCLPTMTSIVVSPSVAVAIVARVEKSASLRMVGGTFVAAASGSAAMPNNVCGPRMADKASTAQHRPCTQRLRGSARLGIAALRRAGMQ